MVRILLIDGHREGRAILARFLDHRGFSVDEADDATEALLALEGDPPGLVISELLEDLPRLVEKVDGVAPGVPILVLSTRSDREARRFVRSLGCRYMAKPAFPRDVVFRVTRLLERPEPSGIPARRGTARSPRLFPD